MWTSFKVALDTEPRVVEVPDGPEYRFIAIREPLRNPSLPGMESQLDLRVPIMTMSDGGWYKVTGVVTNESFR